MTASIENAYSHAFMKIGSTDNNEIVTSCQFFMGKLPMENKICVPRLNFLSKLVTHKENLITPVLGIGQGIL